MHPTREVIRRALRPALIAFSLLVVAWPGRAAEPLLPTKGSAFALQGTTLEGQALATEKLRGKVVLVFYWSTDCAVCRSKMPELRANVAGWRGQPFELVTVSVDRHRGDAVAYAQTVSGIVPQSERMPVLWAGEAGYRDSLGARPQRLPLSLLIDTQGRVAAVYEGRIPAEAWDSIADLMP